MHKYKIEISRPGERYKVYINYSKLIGWLFREDFDTLEEAKVYIDHMLQKYKAEIDLEREGYPKTLYEIDFELDIPPRPDLERNKNLSFKDALRALFKS